MSAMPMSVLTASLISPDGIESSNVMPAFPSMCSDDAFVLMSSPDMLREVVSEQIFPFAETSSRPERSRSLMSLSARFSFVP